ncbi:Phosphate propanoyltransferase [Pelotomaculum schinkii]|uniref:Phosphate propanoyltransferase n=1 Tax=Pelotomaculum schinkii TaxID=78350 RepID=A0A4Y7R9U5_9FIRM|nr:phosphate propanoyltransferase [Pelotomaculum schinkii]TEB05420.1 Phosphate propanoyltransferase [Pelotomaculum schinkii]
MQTSHIQEELVREIVNKYMNTGKISNQLIIPVRVSNHHIHLSQADLETLFGEGYELHPLKELSQKGFYAAKETLMLAGPKDVIKKVRVLGPLRKDTQIEILASDGPKLGIVPPLRISGVLAPAPALTLIGPKGIVVNNMGVMVAWRHIHIDSREAADLHIRESDLMQVKTMGDRAVILSNVKIRAGKFNTELHIDVDEANAAGIKDGDQVEVLL